MSHQEVTYSTLAFLQSSSESQNRLRAGGPQRPRESDDKEFSVSWHLIAIAIRILCLLLMVMIIVLGINFFQCSQEKHQQDEILQNSTQKDYIVQNENCLTKNTLTNKTLASDDLKNKTLQQENKPAPLLIEKKCRKKGIFAKSLQNTGMSDVEIWSCCGASCYYFTFENKNWKGCKEICQRHGLFLLKIDDQDELVFLQSQVYQNNYWIGLSYNDKESKWEWTDKGTPRLESAIMNMTSGSGECAFLTSTRITTINCSNSYNCICEVDISLAFSITKRDRT
ncbi:killer cell lectin-like receptor 2 [Molossus nigricans]